jgi:cell division protein FtsN
MRFSGAAAVRAFDNDLGRKALRVGVALAAGVVAVQPAWGQTVGVTYPKSRSLSDIAAWIVSDTPLQLPQIVDVGPSAVTAVTSAAPTGEPRGFLANIASEAIDPSIGKQEDILSWRIPVEIDCEHRAVRLGDMTGFPSRDLRSSPRVVRGADTQWVAPSPNAPLGAVMKAMCDRDFKRPFASGTKVASAPKARSEPPPGPPPPVVALSPPTKGQPLTSAIAANSAHPAKAAPQKPNAEKSDAAKSDSAKSEAAGPAPAAFAHGSSPYAVQVGASPSQDDAKGLVGRVQKKFGGELSGFKTEVVTATVDGKTVYRALISGFAGPKDANGLCEQLKAHGQACFVRK